MNPSLVVRVALASVVLCSEVPELKAQKAQKAEKNESADVALDQVPELISKIDDQWIRKIEDFKKILAQEEAAKRITEAAAQSLRWSLQYGATASDDAKSIITSASVPSDNTALTKAFQGLEKAQATYQKERTALVEGAFNSIRQGISKLVLESNNPAEIDAFVASIARFRETLQKRPSSAGVDQFACSNAETYLGWLKRLIGAQASVDSAAVAMAMNALRNIRPDRPLFSEEDRNKRFEQVSVPFQKAADDAEKRLEAAIESRKPASELVVALAQFEDAYGKLRIVRQFDQSLQVDPGSGYRSLVGILKAVEADDSNLVKDRIGSARASLRDVGEARKEKVELLLSQWENDFKEEAMKRSQTEAQNLRDRMASAKGPQDLDAIVSEFQTFNANRRLTKDGTREVTSVLTSISNAWKVNNLRLFRQQYGISGALTAEVNALKVRVEREIFAREAHAPELAQPPLAEKPISEAVEALCDQLAQNREWRRLYQIMESRAALGTSDGNNYPGISGSDDTRTGIHSFFAAQNFELAELWLEAVDSYRAVLRCASHRVPVAEAAERIKAILKDHPEASRPPSVPAFGGGFKQSQSRR